MEQRDLTYIIEAHTNQAKKQENRFRKWDKRTPYYVHPIWCAAMIRQEPSLVEEVRIAGSQVLLYHDVLEDTTADLPKWLSSDVKSLIADLIFDSSEDEWENLWGRENGNRRKNSI